MPAVLIKDLPRRLHQRLKARAATSHRSLNSELVTLIEAALGDRAGPPPLAEIDRLRVRGHGPLTQAMLDRARRAGRP